MKVITFTCPQYAATKLAHCMKHYADAAYPPGASECAQASREALYNAAEDILRQCANTNERFTISRRLRTNIKAALTYCEQEAENETVYPLLIKVIKGETVDKNQWPNLA